MFLVLAFSPLLLLLLFLVYGLEDKFGSKHSMCEQPSSVHCALLCCVSPNTVECNTSCFECCQQGRLS